MLPPGTTSATGQGMITPGAISALFLRDRPANPNAVVQVINISSVQNRFKVDLSDGVHFTQSMCSTQIGALFVDKIQLYSLIRLSDTLVNNIQNRDVVILLKIEHVCDLPMKIGDPVPYGSTPVAAAAAAPTTLPSLSHGGGMVPNAAGASTMPSPASSGYVSNTPRSTMMPPTPQPQQSSMSPDRPQVFGTPYQQQQQQRGNSYGYGATSSNGGTGMHQSQMIYPIRALSPYMDKFTIKARVTSKGEVKSWDKGPNNNGKLFSVDLCDADGDEIRATFFKEAADAFYDIIQPSRTYTFSNGRIKMANKKFSSIKNEYEINFGRDVIVNPVSEQENIVTVAPPKVRRISDIEQLPPDSMVDIMGVCLSCGNIQEFTSKAGKPFTKADVEVADQSEASIKVTIWGEKAAEFVPLLQQHPNQIVLVQKAKISDFNGRSLSLSQSSSISLNPDIPESGHLKVWYEQRGSHGGVRALSTDGTRGAGSSKPLEERFTVASIKDLSLGTGPNGDIVDVYGTLTYIRQDTLWYPACPDPDMKGKKVVRGADNRWFCEANSKSYDAPEYRYIMSLSISDHTGLTWLTSFNEAGIKIMGRSANELCHFKETGDPAFDAAISAAMFTTGIYTLKVKEEFYQDKSRKRINAINFRPVEYVSECAKLIAAIKKYN